MVEGRWKKRWRSRRKLNVSLSSVFSLPPTYLPSCTTMILFPGTLFHKFTGQHYTCVTCMASGVHHVFHNVSVLSGSVLNKFILYISTSPPVRNILEEDATIIIIRSEFKKKTLNEIFHISMMLECILCLFS